MPSIGNTLWRVWTVFTRSAITPPEVNPFGWNLGTLSTLFAAGPGRFRARSVQKRERYSEANFCFFLSSKQRATLQISDQPNFTQFAHKTWIWELVNPFGTKFWKSSSKGSFFPKKGKFWVKIFNDFRLQAVISPKWLQIVKTHDQLVSQRNVVFPFLPLESTHSHSPAQQTQTAYQQRRSSIWLPTVVLQSWRGIPNSFAWRRHLTLMLRYCSA